MAGIRAHGRWAVVKDRRDRLRVRSCRHRARGLVLAATLCTIVGLGAQSAAANPAGSAPALGPVSDSPTAPSTAARARPTTATIAGRVTTTAGAPVPYAWVRLMPVAAPGGQRAAGVRTTTDERGRYAFVGLPPMRARLLVQAPAGEPLVDTYWPAAFSRREAGVLSVGARTVTADVELPTGRTVTGRVVDDVAGWLIPGASVVAIVPGQRVPEPVGDVNPTAGAGRFRIDNLPPIAVQLQVRLPPDTAYLGPWYWPAPDPGSDPLAIAADVHEPEVAIRLLRAAQLQGTVRDEAGQPLPRALVQVRGCEVVCPVAVPADGQGRYRIAGIPPGQQLTLTAWQGGEFRTWFDDARRARDATRFALEPGEVRTGVDLTLPRGATLSVRVLGAGGSALTDYLAQLRPADLPATAASRAIEAGGYGPGRNFAAPDRVDPERRVVGPVPAGGYRLVVRPGPTATACAAEPFDERSEGVARDGAMVLAAGDEIDVTVRLRCPAAAAPEPATPAQALEGTGPGGDGCARSGAATGPAWRWPDPREALFEPPAWARTRTR
ncbi:MAG TPA: carboxypeptidase-like regulatory domain-containing protein [Candidatus Nanopelagicales bacterium]